MSRQSPTESTAGPATVGPACFPLRAGFRPSPRIPHRSCAAVLALTLALCGCQRSFYAVQGKLESHGGPLGQWSLAPEGCSIAPFDGLPVDSSGSVVEFVWEHGRPSLWRKQGPEDRWAQGPDYLDISRAAKPSQAVNRTPAYVELNAANGITASVKLVQTRPALQLNAETCNVLRLDSHPGPPVLPGAPASLEGHLVLDCSVNGSHLTGDLDFRGCVL